MLNDMSAYQSKRPLYIGSNKIAIFKNHIISFDRFSTESSWDNTKVSEKRTGVKFLTVEIPVDVLKRPAERAQTPEGDPMHTVIGW